ncbi:MAG: hypothetical protein GXO86_06765 [Chlorobi bacterium]|nr:hypothetical protein [Chlorobiota bacterium]
MNKLFYSLSIFIIFIFFSADLLAQTFKITGEIRPRYEFRHGYKTLFPDDAKAANFISQRTRLNGFFSNNTFTAYISLQDVRVWGDVNQLNKGDVYGFSVHQAWAQVKFTKFMSIKVGRMEIIYDDHRIFGNVGWTQQARSHDAAVLKFFFGDNNKIDVGFAYNAMEESLYQVAYTNKNYKAIQWAYYHGNFGKSGLSVLFLNNGLPYDSDADTTKYDEKVAYSQTFGARYTFSGKKIKANGAFYYQGGKNGKKFDTNHDPKKIQAFYFSANVSFQIGTVFNLGFGGEYLSGTSSQDQARADRSDFSFTPFYGTNHKFNGWMDYFYVGNYVGKNGLIDVYLPIKFKVKKWNFGVIPHYFMAAATISAYNPDEKKVTDYSSSLGTELDFFVKFALSKSVIIQGGYSQMIATETMQVVKYPDKVNSDFYKNGNNWAWVMLTFKPTFYNSDNKKKK